MKTADEFRQEMIESWGSYAAARNRIINLLFDLNNNTRVEEPADVDLTPINEYEWVPPSDDIDCVVVAPNGDRSFVLKEESDNAWSSLFEASELL